MEVILIEIKNLSGKEHLNNIKPYLTDKIINIQKYYTNKIY